MIAQSAAWTVSANLDIHFGAGILDQLAGLVPWQSVLLVTTPGARKRGMTARIEGLLGGPRLTVCEAVTALPDIEELEATAAALRGRDYEGILALGGGSAIDTAKVLSWLLLRPPGSLRPRLEGTSHPDAGEVLPVIAIPTTAGTGAEVTPFATVWDHTAMKKYSLETPFLRPRTAILDPQLLATAPTSLTVSSGLDALCQALESLWSRASNPVTTALALRSLSRTLEFLPRMSADASDPTAAAVMSETSLLAGMAISVTKTTLPHSISYPLTLHFDVPHGLACGLTIVPVLHFNAAHDGTSLPEIAHGLGLEGAAELGSCIEAVMDATGSYALLARDLPDKRALRAVAGQAVTRGRADNNPRSAGTEDIEMILAGAWDTVAQHTES